jgi:hypothetical protein
LFLTESYRGYVCCVAISSSGDAGDRGVYLPAQQDTSGPSGVEPLYQVPPHLIAAGFLSEPATFFVQRPAWKKNASPLSFFPKVYREEYSSVDAACLL